MPSSRRLPITLLLLLLLLLLLVAHGARRPQLAGTQLTPRRPQRPRRPRVCRCTSATNRHLGAIQLKPPGDAVPNGRRASSLPRGLLLPPPRQVRLRPVQLAALLRVAALVGRQPRPELVLLLPAPDLHRGRDVVRAMGSPSFAADGPREVIRRRARAVVVLGRRLGFL